MKVKAAEARIKALDPAEEAAGGEEGVFEALVSVFGNRDSYGDVVVKGAFAETLAEWEASGNPIPVIWSHGYQDPENHIGQVLEAKETDEGLWVKARLDLDAPRAAQVYRLLKGRRVTGFSFSYEVVDGQMAKADGQDVFELRKLRLFEVGPTLIGANPAAQLQDVKAALAAAKAGRVLSAKNEQALNSALEKISGGIKDIKSVLAALTSDESDDGKSAVSGPAKDEEPHGAKSEEPSRAAADDLAAVEALQLATELTA